MRVLDTSGFHSNYVSGIRIEENFGQFRISCKIGAYCTFGIEQISNQRHFHDVYELCIVTSGEGTFLHDNTSYTIAKGDIFLADAGVLHEVRSLDPAGMQLLYIFIGITENPAGVSARSFEDQLMQDFLSRHAAHSGGHDYLLSYLEFIESYNSRKGNRSFSTYGALKNLILESMAILCGSAYSTGGRMVTQSAVELALDYIDVNLNQRMKVPDIAHYACTSQRNLEHLFQKHVGNTVIGYINERKVNLACYYLAMNFSVSDTGRLVGVPDVVQFSRLFKKIKGMPPKRYQETKAPDTKGTGRRLL